MFHSFTFDEVLKTSERAAWAIEDVIPAEAALDFGRPFLPESLARIGDVDGLDAAERRTLNQIRGCEYLSMFGLVEEFVLPFVLDHAHPLSTATMPASARCSTSPVRKPSTFNCSASSGNASTTGSEPNAG